MYKEIKIGANFVVSIMVEFSLLDLREFVAAAAKYNCNFQDYSSISLRLALQRVCEELKIKQCSEFLQAYLQSAGVRRAVKVRVATHPRELLRDICTWQQVLTENRALLENQSKKVLLLDNSLLSDCATFLICAQIFNIELCAEIHCYSRLQDSNFNNRYVLSSKDLEAAQANTSALNIDVTSFLKFEAEKYCLDFANKIKPAKFDTTLNRYLPVSEKYDLIISQNNSLVYNFSGQEHFFRACYAACNVGGGLFFGTKENLGSSGLFTMLSQPKKDINYYLRFAN